MQKKISTVLPGLVKVQPKEEYAAKALELLDQVTKPTALPGHPMAMAVCLKGPGRRLRAVSEHRARASYALLQGTPTCLQASKRRCAVFIALPS